MQLPLIHVNGSGAHNLIVPLYEASNHIYAAIRVLESEGAPNARDYYPLGPDAFNVATREHADRLVKLQTVRAELQALIDHIEFERD